MKTILLISIIYITYIICNNKHLKQSILDNPVACSAMEKYGVLTDLYQTVVTSDLAVNNYFIKNGKIAHLDVDNKKYTFYKSERQTFNDDELKYPYKLTSLSTTTVNTVTPSVTDSKNYNYPWSPYTGTAVNNLEVGFVEGGGGGFSTTCIKPTNGQEIINLNSGIKLKELPGDLVKYEQFDQYTESITEERKDITNDDVGLGKKLFQLVANTKFSYIYLHKERFCYYTCSFASGSTPVECSLLAYPKSSNVKLDVNKAMYIKPDETTKPKYYDKITKDTTAADFKDLCVTAEGRTLPDLCTGSKFAFMSKKGTGTNYIFNGYISTATGVTDKFAPKPTDANNEMPDDIKTKFSEFTYCFQDDNPVQGVSDIFINTLLLTIIILLMI